MIAEKYTGSGDFVVRKVKSGALQGTSRVRKVDGRRKNPDAHHQWWQSILSGQPTIARKAGEILTVDLFCGTGGLSLGAALAVEAVAKKFVAAAAVDIDVDALHVYRKNFEPKLSTQTNVSSLIDYHVYGRAEDAELGYTPELIDGRFADLRESVDLVLAGPPCQGHSNLNNHTRRSDPRNVLYVSVAAIAIALKTRMLVVENVPEVLADSTKVVDTARKILRDSGYHVSDAVLSANELGGAQTRRRHFLVATRNPHCDLPTAAAHLRRSPITLKEAIGDLVRRKNGSFMDEIGTLSAENQSRIDYLFDHKMHDLPNAVRPDCHKNGHTYPSVYGRMHWNKPAQTITSGFSSPGRGRFIHPSQRRVITPREAARIQGFPDTFVFSASGEAPSRKLLTKWIGDAVPSWLGYAAVLTALSGYSA